jgi:hypothetical protein
VAVLTASALRGALSAALGPDAELPGISLRFNSNGCGRSTRAARSTRARLSLCCWRCSAPARVAAYDITVHQRPLEETSTASKSCKWLGEAILKVGPTRQPRA